MSASFFFFLFPQRREVVFQERGKFLIGREPRSEGDEAKAVIFIGEGRGLSGKDGPHFFHGAAVPQGVVFIHVPVVAGIHVAVGVELDADVRTGAVGPEAVNVPIFEVRHERAVIEVFQ